MPKISDDQWLSRKKNIIDTAFELFSQHGYSQVSVNDIVKSANISKGGFYTYFESKQEIFYEILRESDRRKSAMVSDIQNPKGASDRLYIYLKSRLQSFMEIENRKWVKFAIEFWSTVHQDDVLLHMNKSRYSEFHEEIGGLIQDGIQEGEFRKDLELDAIIYAIISMLDGIALMSSVMTQLLDETKLETIVELLMSYLKSPAKTGAGV